jgi:ABC-2 family transporter protein
MNTIRVLYHLALADFYERARRTRFLLVLAVVIYLGVLVNNGTVFFYLMSSDLSALAFRFRGEFNSAWVGTMTVLVTNSFLGLFGFYLVSDCIERDIRTGVGQIIATTPVRRATYLIGKWISNFAVLSMLELIMALAAAVMVLLKGDAALGLETLLMPFLAVALPCMALIAALSVVFETVPWLRGALGNALYLFLWLFLLLVVLVGGTLLGVLNDSMGAGASVSTMSPNTGAIMELPSLKDPMGFNVFRESLSAGVLAAYPNEQISLMGVQAGPAPKYKVFNWPGLDWTPGIIAGQWLWAVIGLGLILLSAVWFARFDPAREGLRRARGKPGQAIEGKPAMPQKKALRLALPSLSPLISKLAQVNPFLGVLFAELRILLKGRRWWWWAITIGLNIAILTKSSSLMQDFLLPFAWLWPMSVWSGMGNRERKNNTSQMVFSSGCPVLRQLPAAWLAGILTTALLVIGGAVFFLSTGDMPGLAGWVGGVIFIPTLALALGVFSSGSRVFEVVYVLWWYIGPLTKSKGMDFTSGTPQFYLLAAAGLLLLSAFWRGRQVRL